MSGAIRLPAAVGPVAPAAPAPAAGGGLAALAGNKNVLMAGAAAVVVIVALIKRKPAAAPAPDPVATANTTPTDVYNDLQPELENIAKQIGDLKPMVPPVPTPTTPKPPAPAPKPIPKTGWVQHTIQKGQNYQYLAALYSTTVQHIYMANIKGRTRADGTPGVLVSYKDFKPGVRLVIPRAIVGNKT